MRHGIVILPQDPWVKARRRWQSAEGLGFDHAWTYDHLSWRSLAGERWHATVPTLTAAALVTTTLRLGTFVASPNFRHPVPFAKEVATLDEISAGRVILGLGSGGTGFDSTVLGQRDYTPRERHERFSEFVTALDVLLRHEEPESGGIDLDGDWFTARGARMVGEPAQRPRVPFVLAANGPKGLALVAERAQGWVTTGPTGTMGEEWWNGLATLARRLDQALEVAGRDPRDIERHLSLDSGGEYSLDSVARFEDMAGRADQLGFTDVVSHWPRREGIYAGDDDVLYEVASHF
ncbi:LLM class flavin-dependent oxidoreductase [Rathayibacter iranicus]|uniref:LLM class flavin-dependent oxidoreductase n=2 Tax=Rathayibacter iranicus TaxID=59737 RepID=A0AAD1AFI5_9MICO|nr:LLM class flavin-dependent oxidoreductase [Rathayibacter iranicus]AZZ55226.1 LLM class flavin-dependent oxidoreductase [Rathayibacter iranicus]MWV31532.1 LLM class flavin-dependent oxidoreductase [Rathayibacter iranicus NCPPB 2253 = VKM Ac-1602]PPI49360.1 LLM class flavin-dependent oxidoreductase [Rathayibacter iranicus]PPI61617.1 LLM class flavin-dependent oxidoreductase [Rathayibacter iranicus]PPI72070.1 LLM class flavin-dependent oxidoreductase [Rathayibacter iranicus]